MAESTPASPTPDSQLDARERRRREDQEYSLKRPLIMFAIVAALAAGGWFLMKTLGDASRIQDCVMKGLHNCARIDTGEDR